MRKFLLGTSMLLILLSSCSKNEFVDGSGSTYNDGKVRFAATSNRVISRAADNNPITGTKDLQDNVKTFHVTGFAAGATTTPLVDSDVTWNGASWEYADEPYWPSTAMDFFAYANWGSAPTISSTGISADVTIGQDQIGVVGGQKDLLVAALDDATKEVRTTLNFKHALTQVVFKAGNLDDAKLQVRIGGMRIVNVAETGKIAVSAGTNGAGIAWTNNTTLSSKYYVQGLQTAAEGAFGPNASAAATAATNAFAVATVSETTPYKDYQRLQLAGVTGDNALMLIPQTFAAWDPNAAKPAVTTGAYIELLAIINDPAKLSITAQAGEAAYYYCGTPKAGDQGVNDEYGRIYIPIESAASEMNEWTPGKRISYIITFGDKGSGSGGGGYDEDNNPVLVPIKFKAVVEDWVDVDIPLLTASFSATSDNITAAFIDGFTNQLFNDIAAAKEEKTYRANINISGVLPANATISFVNIPETKIAVGSTVTYNFTKITTWTGSSTISMAVPSGWSASSFLNAGTNAVETKTNDTISVDGNLSNKIVLTKIS